MSARLAVAAAVLVLASCALCASCASCASGRPPPRACAIEAPPVTTPAPVTIGMCSTDPPPDAGAPATSASAGPPGGADAAPDGTADAR
ncbi:MAG: hypothetical protein NVS3B10_14970 [Polyangiales bacterium]